jgi:hypothetical protein
MGVQAQISKHIIIKDRKYNIEEFKIMREKLLQTESKVLNDKLHNNTKNFIDWLTKAFTEIKSYMSGIFNRINISRKNKKLYKKNYEKDDIYDEVQNKVEET